MWIGVCAGVLSTWMAWGVAFSITGADGARCLSPCALYRVVAIWGDGRETTDANVVRLRTCRALLVGVCGGRGAMGSREDGRGGSLQPRN